MDHGVALSITQATLAVINKAKPQGVLRVCGGAQAACGLRSALGWRNLPELPVRSHRFGRMPSTVIQSFHYDANQRELLIVFRSGRRYVYEGVAEETYQAMRRSFSKGEYFNEHIRDHYAFRREA